MHEQIKYKLKDNIETKTITITPEDAKQIIEFTKHKFKNRSISPSMIKFLSGEMERGSWKQNGEPLIFSKEGYLIDGQHRLQAIIVSDTIQKFLCVYNVDAENFDTIDQGRKRSIGDLIFISNENLNTNEAVILGHSYNWYSTYKESLRVGTWRYLRIYNNSWELEKFQEDKLGFIEALSKYKTIATRTKKFLNTTYTVFMIFYFKKYISVTTEDRQRFFDFLKKLETGEEISSRGKTSAIYWGRDYLLNIRSSKSMDGSSTVFNRSKSQRRFDEANIVNCCWNVFNEGREYTARTGISRYLNEKNGFVPIDL